MTLLGLTGIRSGLERPAAVAGARGARVRTVFPASCAPRRAVAGSADAARAPVDRACLSVRRLFDHGARLDHQHPAFHQAGGDGVPSSRKDAGVGLSRHGHPLGGSVLVETFQVGETDGLEFIAADGDRRAPVRGGPDRPEATGCQLLTDATGDDRAGHGVESICSQSGCVNTSHRGPRRDRHDVLATRVVLVVHRDRRGVRQLAASRAQTPRPGQSAASPGPSVPSKQEDVRWTNGGVSLAGTLSLPPSSTPVPAVVLISGRGTQKDRTDPI